MTKSLSLSKVSSLVCYIQSMSIQHFLMYKRCGGFICALRRVYVPRRWWASSSSRAVRCCVTIPFLCFVDTTPREKKNQKEPQYTEIKKTSIYNGRIEGRPRRNDWWRACPRFDPAPERGLSIVKIQRERKKKWTNGSRPALLSSWLLSRYICISTRWRTTFPIYETWTLIGGLFDLFKQKRMHHTRAVR